MQFKAFMDHPPEGYKSEPLEYLRLKMTEDMVEAHDLFILKTIVSGDVSVSEIEKVDRIRLVAQLRDFLLMLLRGEDIDVLDVSHFLDSKELTLVEENLATEMFPQICDYAYKFLEKDIPTPEYEELATPSVMDREAYVAYLKEIGHRKKQMPEVRRLDHAKLVYNMMRVMPEQQCMDKNAAFQAYTLFRKCFEKDGLPKFEKLANYVQVCIDRSAPDVRVNIIKIFIDLVDKVRAENDDVEGKREINSALYGLSCFIEAEEQGAGTLFTSIVSNYHEILVDGHALYDRDRRICRDVIVRMREDDRAYWSEKYLEGFQERYERDGELSPYLSSIEDFLGHVYVSNRRQFADSLILTINEMDINYFSTLARSVVALVRFLPDDPYKTFEDVLGDKLGQAFQADAITLNDWLGYSLATLSSLGRAQKFDACERLSLFIDFAIDAEPGSKPDLLGAKLKILERQRRYVSDAQQDLAIVEETLDIMHHLSDEGYELSPKMNNFLQERFRSKVLDKTGMEHSSVEWRRISSGRNPKTAFAFVSNGKPPQYLFFGLYGDESKIREGIGRNYMRMEIFDRFLKSIHPGT